MELTVDRKALLNLLIVGGAMSGKSRVMPILDYSKFKVVKNKLILSSFDEEVAVTKRIDLVSSDGEVEFCANTNDLVKFIKTLKDETVTITTTDKQMSIKHSKGHGEYPILPATEFPMVSIDPENDKFNMDSRTLWNWLNISRGFVSSDPLRPQMCGMYMYFSGNSCGVCATDAHRMFTDDIKLNEEYKDTTFVIAIKAFSVIMNLLEESENVTIIIDNKNITFKNENSKVSVRLLEGRFPNYRAIIPSEHNISISADKKDLLDSVNRIKICSSTGTSMVVLQASGMTLDLSAQDTSLSIKGSENCFLSNHEGEDIKIGVNGEFFAHCLSTIESDEIVVELTNPNRPFVIKDSENPSRVILLCPMAL